MHNGGRGSGGPRLQTKKGHMSGANQRPPIMCLHKGNVINYIIYIYKYAYNYI